MAKKKPNLESVRADFNSLAESDKQAFLLPHIVDSVVKEAVRWFRTGYSAGIEDTQKLLPHISHRGKVDRNAIIMRLRQTMSQAQAGMNPELVKANAGKRMTARQVAAVERRERRNLEKRIKAVKAFKPGSSLQIHS